MPLFKKGNSGNLSKKNYNVADRDVEQKNSMKEANFDGLPPRPPKNIANKSNPSASSQQSTAQTSDSPRAKRSNGKPYEKSETDMNGKTTPKFIFYCQLAHGSPTCEIQGFTNVKELYGKISESFKIDLNEVSFFDLIVSLD